MRPGKSHSTFSMLVALLTLIALVTAFQEVNFHHDDLGPKPSIFIVYAGGTIGMVPTPSGYAPKPGYLSSVMEKIFYFQAEDTPRYTVHECDPLIDSSNAQPDDWVKMARLIYENYDKYDGFVVIHGTDTMAYTSSALSFLLGPQINKTVVVTGSQIPVSQTFNDGVFNLIGSLFIAAYSNIPEVVTFFDGTVMRGNRVQKMSAYKLRAFTSELYPNLAEWGTSLIVRRDLVRGKGSGILKEPIELTGRVVHLRIYPGISAETVRSVVDGVNGIILACYGAGNVPDSNSELMQLLKEAHDNGAVIVVVSQTPVGIVQFGEYAVSGALKAIGAVSGFDMTAEAALTKLTWLTSLGLSQKAIERKIGESVVGEITPFSSNHDVDKLIDVPHVVVPGGVNNATQ